MNEEFDKNKCPNTASIAVPWAGKILELCEVHANGIVVLGNVIGSPVQPKRILSNQQCQGNNDLEEYTKKD